MLPEFLTSREVAAFLRVHPTTLWRMRRANIGPKAFFVGGRLRYKRAEVEAYVRQAA